MEEDTSQPSHHAVNYSTSSQLPLKQHLGVGEVDSLLSEDHVDALPSKLHYSALDLFFTLISIVTYVADLSMDIIVAVYFYHLGVSHGEYHYWYFGLTVTFILLPSLTMTGFSFRWYVQDADKAKSSEKAPEVPLYQWIIRLVVLMLQIAPVLRYIDSIRYGLMSRYAMHKEKKAESREERDKYRADGITYYTLMVYEEADGALLRLFECFMESAPQLVLQIYILLRDPHAIQLNERRIVDDDKADPIIKTSILVVSVVASLISLAWSLVVYHRSLRYSDQSKKNIGFAGGLFQFLWHFFSITARVLALSLFASIYPHWIGPVCVAHWAVMTTWLLLQRTQACNTRCEEFFFNIVLGAVYIFCFFSVKDERTRFKYLIFYTFCFVENTVLIIFWFLLANSNLGIGETHWYWIPGIVGHYAMFFAGIFCMLLYYGCFHPSRELPEAVRQFKIRRWRRKMVRDAQQDRTENKCSSEQEVKPQFMDLREVGGRSLSRSTPSQLDDLDSPDHAVGGVPSGHAKVRKTSSAPAHNPHGSFADVRTLKSMW